MDRFKETLLIIVSSSVSVGLSADPLEIPNEFVAGEPAVASQVNENFAAIEAAVDDNFARILRLDTVDEALRAADESLFAADERLSAADANLAGSIRSLETTLGVQPFNSALTLSSLLRVAPYEGILFPTVGAAPFGILTTYHDYNGVRDHALYYGYNTGPNNEVMVANEPRLVWNLESNYSPRPGANWMEVNLDYTDSTGSAWKRFLAFYLDRNQAQPDGAWAMVGGDIKLENPINQEQFTFRLSADDARRTVFQYGGLGRRRLQFGYDGTWISPDAIDIGPSSLTTPELSVMRAEGLSDSDTAIMLLWRNGQLLETRQVEVGAPDSGGAGYRMLRIAN